MKLDPTKEYQYRNGEKPWKIIWDVPNSTFPIVSISDNGDSISHYSDGRFMYNGDDSQWDLIEVKKKIGGWVNIYNPISFFESKEDADKRSAPDRIACVYVEFTEGEGL